MQLAFFDCWGGPTPESSGPADALCRHNLAIRANPQTVLSGNGDGCLYRSRSLSHWIGLRMELACSQCGQIKTTSWVSCYLSKRLKCCWHRATTHQNLPDQLNWQILC